MVNKFRFTNHAEQELRRRDIPKAVVEDVLANPQQVVPMLLGQSVYQSRVDFPDGRTYLVRAIVDNRQRPPAVVTVYRTSKIAKYWRAP